LPRGRGARGTDDPVDLLGDDVAQHRQDHQAATDEGRERVDACEAPCVPVTTAGRIRAHRPARCASPWAARRTRSSSATSTGRPGMSPLLAGEAVLTVMSASPMARLYGP